MLCFIEHTLALQTTEHGRLNACARTRTFNSIDSIDYIDSKEDIYRESHRFFAGNSTGNFAPAVNLMTVRCSR